MPKKVGADRWRKYTAARRAGMSIYGASKEAKIAYQTARSYEKGLPTSSGVVLRKLRGEEAMPQAIPLERLSDPARKALDDFAYFRRRYFGRISTPWQEEAAYKIAELLETRRKEYVVINAPPGSGKSTTFSLEIPAWITCRNRAIRGMIASETMSLAKRYAGRLKRALENPYPMKAEDEARDLGLAVDAETTLIADFGRFKPEDPDVWRIEEFIVAQHDNRPLSEKEPTWSAYGRDSGYIGGRFDIIVCDDLFSAKSLKTLESITGLRDDWDKVLEKRLEPGGLLVLQGQRLGSEDLYRYALDKRTGGEDSHPKYIHIKYKAHFTDRCRERHGEEAPPYPEGCLLDPRRLPWRELEAEMANNESHFETVYQQEDVDPKQVLVRPIWVSGGQDSEGLYPGCWDNDRDLCQLPRGLAGPIHSIATVDPSPTKMWATQWWCYTPESEYRFLMDLERKAMTADQLLDWDYASASFVGIMEDWQQRSKELGFPITHWIIEVNAAQRYLLAYDHVRRWMAKWGVSIVPHTTTVKKLDPEFGPLILQNAWKTGRVRLPGSNVTNARVASLKLVDEVTRYPSGRYDDQVMAEWFLEANLPSIASSSLSIPRRWVPTWMKRAG